MPRKSPPKQPPTPRALTLAGVASALRDRDEVSQQLWDSIVQPFEDPDGEPFVHGVERLFANPFAAKKRCIMGAWALSTDGACTVQSVTVRNVLADGVTTSPYPKSPAPLMGITVWFTQPYGAISLRKSANQSILISGSRTPVIWETEIEQYGAFSHIASDSKIYFTQAGRVSASWSVVYAANATGYRTTYLDMNGVTSGTNTRYGIVRVPNAGAADQTMVSASVVNLEVEDGDYVEIAAQQNSGFALDIIGALTNECEAQLVFTGTATSYSAGVVCNLW